MVDHDITEIAKTFLSLCAKGEVQSAYDRYVAPTFRHHNPYFASDRASLLHGMEEIAVAEPNKSFTVKQAIASGDRVAVYSHLRRENVDMDIAVVHILRFENGQIVEMWDVGQEVPKESPNDLGMF